MGLEQQMELTQPVKGGRPAFPDGCATSASRLSLAAVRARARGLTLLEVMVVMVLMVAVMSLAAPYVGGALGLELRTATRQLTGTMRFLFDESIIRSSNFRLVFNLDKHGYLVEQCSGNASLLYRGALEREKGEELEAEKQRRRERMTTTATQAAMPISDAALRSCQPAKDPELQPVALKEPLTLLGVWTPQYRDVIRPNPNGPPDDPAEEQIAVVNFLKGGYAERAFVYLSDGGDEIFTLELEPLTGNVLLHDGEYPVPREYLRN